jgi:hypothetical protein
MDSCCSRSKTQFLAALLLGSWVRIKLETWIKILCVCFCFMLSCIGRGLCDGLKTRPKDSYQVS